MGTLVRCRYGLVCTHDRTESRTTSPGYTCPVCHSAVLPWHPAQLALAGSKGASALKLQHAILLVRRSYNTPWKTVVMHNSYKCARVRATPYLLSDPGRGNALLALVSG